MRKILTLVVVFALVAQTLGAASLRPAPLQASEMLIPVGNTGKSISMLDLSVISVKDFEAMSGTKMKWADRMMFKSAQRELRHSINEDGTLNNRKIEKFYKKYKGEGDADVTAGFNVGGFALGFLLSIIGVLLAYIINSDDPANFRKWAWIGFGVSLALILLFAII